MASNWARGGGLPLFRTSIVGASGVYPQFQIGPMGV
jgi:hypothetical protein